jgi:hypothetical protein
MKPYSNCLFIGLLVLAAGAQAYGQGLQRVGINTVLPDSTLDVRGGGLNVEKGARFGRAVQVNDYLLPAAKGQPGQLLQVPATGSQLRFAEGLKYDPATGLQIGGPAALTVGPNTPIGPVPPPYQGSSADARSQYLFRAADLLAAGLRAGAVTALAFNVTTKNSTQPFQNFTIRMGNTAATQATGNFASSGTTAVFTGTVTTALGWNTHQLQTPFGWDGSSNMYVETCFDNPTSVGGDDFVTHSSASYLGIYTLSTAAGTSGCSLAPGAGISVYNGAVQLQARFSQDHSYSLPPSGGTADQVLVQQANGSVAWTDQRWQASGADVYRAGGKLGLGVSAPISRLANTALNIIDPTSFGINGSSLTWAHNDQGYAAAFYNANTSFDGRGLAVKIASAAPAATALDVSQGSGQESPGTSLLRVQGDGRVGLGTTWMPPRLTLSPTTLEAKISLWATNTTDHYGFGISPSQLNYEVENGGSHVFYAGGKNGSGKELLRIQSNGHVGIGTNAPAGPLHLVNDGGGPYDADDYLIDEYGDGDQALYFRKAEGSRAAPANLYNGAHIGRIAFVPRRGGVLGYGGGSDIRSNYRGDGTTSLTDLQLYTSGSERLRISENGRVGVGTSAPAGWLHLLGQASSGYVVPGGSTELLFGSGGLTRAAAIQTIDDGQYGGGLYFNVHQGGLQGAPNTDNWPANVTTALTLHPSGNVGVGLTSPSYKLDVAGNVNSSLLLLEGWRALYRRDNNFFVGTVNYNPTAPTGSNNTAVGINAGYSLTSGFNNTMVGMLAGDDISTGSSNVLVGIQAGGGLRTGSDNVFIGHDPGINCAAGNGNVGLGSAALQQVTANYNTGLGNGAGTNVTTGEFNTFVGGGANLSSGSQRSRATALGYNAHVDQDDALVLGDPGNTAVRVGIGTNTPAAKLDVRGLAQLGSQGGAALRLLGAGTGSHSYQEFYPEGSANGRKSYFGFPGDGNHSVSLINEYADGGMALGTNGTGTVQLRTASQARLTVNGSGSVTVASLAGSGSRVVTADAGGNLSTSTSASTALDELLKMQKGTVTVGPNPGSTFKTVVITFPTPFSAIPNVTCTARNEFGVIVNDTFAVSIRNLGTNTCTVNVQRVDNTTTGWTQNLLLNWLALP